MEYLNELLSKENVDDFIIILLGSNTRKNMATFRVSRVLDICFSKQQFPK